jgi:NTE family protein
MSEQKSPARPESYDKKVALVLQGGGALGSYQAGVYEALSTSQYMPDWIAGISVGAINAAIIAGNAPERRVERLNAFWEGITMPSSPWPTPSCMTVDGHRRTSSINTLMFGQPGFFAPRSPMHWLLGAKPTSYYDTRPLKDTLERLVDFDRINAREIRFSIAAVNVRTGNFAYFDNAQMIIRPEHVMASSALPPEGGPGPMETSQHGFHPPPASEQGCS